MPSTITCSPPSRPLRISTCPGRRTPNLTNFSCTMLLTATVKTFARLHLAEKALRHIELDLDRIQINQPYEDRVPGDDLAGADVARADDSRERRVDARVLQLAFPAIKQRPVHVETGRGLIVFLLRN